MAVTNFNITSSAYDEETDTYTLNFSFRNIDTNDSGYELHAVKGTDDSIIETYIDPANLTYVDHREKSITTTDGVKTFILVITGEIFGFGEIVDFYMKVYTNSNTSTLLSTTTRFKQPGSKITDLLVSYTGQNVILNWTPDTESSLLENYVVEVAQGQPIAFTIVDQFIGNIIFESESFELGTVIVVQDILNGYLFSATVTTSGFLYISNASLKNTLNHLIYINYSPLNFKLFKVSEIDFVVFQTIQKQFFTGTIEFPFNPNDSFQIFRVKKDPGDINLFSNTDFVQVIFIKTKFPKFYPIYETEDEYYNDPSFFTMRSALVDKNVYKKDMFSLPHKENEPYQLRGYLGITGGVIDVFADNELLTTVESDANGEFTIFLLPQTTEVILTVQAYNANRSEKFTVSTNHVFTKLIMYSYLAVLSQEINDIVTDGITANFNDLALATASVETVKSFFGRMIGLEFSLEETDDDFVTQIKALYPLFHRSNSDGKNLLENILNVYTNDTFGIKKFNIFEKGDVFGTNHNQFVIGKSILTKSSSLSNQRYRYYVTSSLKLEPLTESFPITIDFDTRIFGTSTGIYSANSFSWKPVGGNDLFQYNIYRKVNDGEIEYLRSTEGLNFLDTNDIVGTNRQFPTFGYFDTPSVLDIDYYPTSVTYPQQMKDHINNFLFVVIYEDTVNNPIKDSIKARLRSLIRKVITNRLFVVIKFEDFIK